jgi:hypothetical protein
MCDAEYKVGQHPTEFRLDTSLVEWKARSFIS